MYKFYLEKTRDRVLNQKKWAYFTAGPLHININFPLFNKSQLIIELSGTNGQNCSHLFKENLLVTADKEVHKEGFYKP